MAVSVTKRIDATAVLLLVERFALADFNHPLRTTVLAPVISPVHEIVISCGSTFTAAVDLIHVLPARDAERARDRVETVFVCVQRGALESHIEALRAAFASLWFIF